MKMKKDKPSPLLKKKEQYSFLQDEFKLPVTYSILMNPMDSSGKKLKNNSNRSNYYMNTKTSLDPLKIKSNSTIYKKKFSNSTFLDEKAKKLFSSYKQLSEKININIS